MYDMFEKLDPYTSSASTLFEPVARLPYLLHAPAVVTHIPLFNKSAEDDNFEQHVCRLRAFIEETIDGHCELDKRTATDIRKEFASSRRAALAQTLDFDADYFDTRAAKIWQTCKDGIRYVAGSFPELFIFESLSLIDKELNKFVHGKCIREIRKSEVTQTHLPVTEDKINTNLFHLVNSVLHYFLPLIPSFIESFQKKYSLASLPTSPEQSQDILGGIVSWFDQTDPSRSRPSIDTNSYLRIFWRGKPKPAPGNGPRGQIWDKYLIWRRGDQGWRYTFCDGIFNYTDPKVTNEVLGFVNKLFGSANLRHSFPNLGVLQENLTHPAAEKYRFPGTRLGGAQYFMIPVELLVLCAARFDDLAKLSASTVRAFAGVTAANGIALPDCIKGLCDLPCFDQATRQRLGECLEKVITTNSQFLHALDEIKACFQTTLSKMSTSKGARKSTRELHLAVARLSECLWKWVYSDVSEERGADDFIATSVVDGRALYFSNFRPIFTNTHEQPRLDLRDTTGFTRTFFVDFSLTPYQRGRLARRLCEIATYRLASIRDIERIRALQDGINQLSQVFNRIVGKFGAAKEIQLSIDESLDLNRRILQFDRFLTEGVSGRRLIADGDWGRVQRQVRDIREQRVPGYAKLGDFLQRGLAITIADISRAAGRYEGLRNRVRDHLSRIRTELSAQSTKAIVEHTRRVAKQSKHQTEFLRAADLLVIVGGAYYLRSEFNYVLQALKIEPKDIGPRWIFVELCLLVGAIFLVYVLKNILVGRSLARIMRRPYQKIRAGRRVRVRHLAFMDRFVTD